MKRLTAVLIVFFSFFCGHSQKIQTIVPKQVVAGNAFQIQYIIGNPSALAQISSPQFDNLQIVSGPNYYKGNSLINGKSEPIENITYTVVPLKTGIIKINAITIQFKNGTEQKSDEIAVSVTSQPKASFNPVSTYTDINLYAPSSKTDLEKLIETNLFIKAEVDKKVCFLGEAIMATFKLYSRLQSTSEVINTPSLYGFSVMDMLDINEAHQAVETINGKVFNTSVLRKLQLYPAQTGKLTIDEMQLQNTIEFEDSSQGKKIKVERLLTSNPIDIVVKSLPAKQPDGYTGAVGKFILTASLQKSEIEANKQGKLVVTINGEGNFIQFGAPAVSWPKEFDVFDPVVSDGIDKNSIPTEGTRKYVYSFITDKAGVYSIPPISFSFFDPSSKKYRELRTDSIRPEIIQAGGRSNNKGGLNQAPKFTSTWLLVIPVIIMGLLIVFLYGKNKKQEQASEVQMTKKDYLKKLNELVCQQLSDKQFYSQVRKLLLELSSESVLSKEQELDLLSIQSDCQLLIYSDVNAQTKREDLGKKVEAFVKALQN